MLGIAASIARRLSALVLACLFAAPAAVQAQGQWVSFQSKDAGFS